MGEEFRSKPEMAFEEMIAPLKIPDGTRLYTVFDSWWYGQEFIDKIKALGHEVVCQLKVNKKPILNGGETKLRYLRGDYKEVELKARGKRKRDTVPSRRSPRWKGWAGLRSWFQRMEAGSASTTEHRP